MNSSVHRNLLADIPAHLSEELIEVLGRTETVHIERIVSRGHTSPPGFWYDQDQDEFVLLLNGGARLDFDAGPPVELSPGDWLIIPAHQRHRVAWTDPTRDTVWLAVHYR